MSSNNFLKGAALLAGAGLVTKLIGALYRIPFARIVGEEGMGLYQMAYPIYTMILAFATAGVPVAISMMVADRKAKNDYRGMERILLISLALLIFFGLLSSIALYKGAYFLATQVLQDHRAYYSLVALSPALFFAAVISAFRGYFQGMMIMVPTAISQILEQVARVATVFFASYILLGRGIEFAAAGATFGAVIGSMAALVVLVIYYLWWRYRQQPFGKQSLIKSPGTLEIVKKIGILAIPISLGGLVMPLMQTIDAAMVPVRLQAAGYDVRTATALFGQFSGMAATLINLPTIVTISLAASLVPAISDAMSKSNHGLVVNRLNEAIRLSVMLCLPAAVGLFLLAEEIALLLYGIPQVGVSIKVLAPAAFFLGLHQITAGAIQGLGKTYLPVKHLFFGALAKVVLNYYLTAIPSLGIKGAGIATVASFALAFGLNLNYLSKSTSFKLSIRYHLLKPVIAATIMAFSIGWGEMVLAEELGNSLLTLALIGWGVMAYGLTLLLTGGIKGQDIAIIPKIGPKAARILVRMKIVRW